MRSCELTYQGKALSLNKVKSQNWRDTHEDIKRLKTAFSWLIIEAKVPKFNRFKISLFYNSKHDLDNHAFLCKKLCDCLKIQGRIKEDNKNYYRGLTIEPDETLPPNTYKFLISEVN
jgi:Holliday junction resolvase RusA-like endonuclease